MHPALLLMTFLGPLAFVALGARLAALRAPSLPPPPRPRGATLPLRVRVALQAAARARR